MKKPFWRPLVLTALLLPLAAAAQPRKPAPAPARPARPQPATGAPAKAPRRAAPVVASGAFELLAGTEDNFDTVRYRDGTGRAARFSRETSLAVNAAGTVYVADTDNHVIRKITAAGVVSTLAGKAGQTGSADGPGALARFDEPTNVALDAAGVLYVTDCRNQTIRKITPAGVVSTWAGAAGQSGSTDGTGAAARFDLPRSVAVVTANPGGGTVYVVDVGAAVIRRVSREGKVSTLAGVAGKNGRADGLLTQARFNVPVGVAVDAAGVVYVADMGDHLIRRVSPRGEVTTLAGTADEQGSADGLGTAARFSGPTGVAVDATGTLYVSDFESLRVIAPGGAVTTLPALANRHLSGVAVGPKGRLYVTTRSGAVLVRR